MAKSSTRKTKAKSKEKPKAPLWKRPFIWLRKWVFRLGLAATAILLLWIALYIVVNPPTTAYIISEKNRLGSIDREWVPIDEVTPFLPRSIVAAEDANFCNHWGFDMGAIRDAIERTR